MKTFQQLLDSTKRNQYTDKDIVDSVKPHKPQDITFFTLGRYVLDDDLEKEYQKRGLTPVHPYALASYSLENENVMLEKKWICTHWRDSNGKWCYATFDQWRGDERSVLVGRVGDDWDGDWWFAGVRKYEKELGSLDSLLPVEHLDILENRVKNLENDMEKIKKFLIL